MKILIVEDEVNTREGLAMLIRGLCPDAAVSLAECGQQAIELCSNHFFDLIFTDIRMPGMSGFQMLSQLDRKGRMIMGRSCWSMRPMEPGPFREDGWM